MKVGVAAVCVALLVAVCSVEALNNGLGKTPQMGWNSWNYFACNLNEQIVNETIDNLISSGLAAAGYRYVVLTPPPFSLFRRASFSRVYSFFCYLFQ
jgi:hypothetical protein